MAVGALNPRAGTTAFAQNFCIFVVPGWKMSGILLPGDAIAADTSASVLLGPGFTPSLHATVAGLHAASSDGEAEQRHLLLSSAKRYAAPALHDPVIACVVSRSGDSYIMDINGVRTATLGVLDFPGATKRNKPELVVLNP